MANELSTSNEAPELDKAPSTEQHGVLGAITDYPTLYDAKILYPIPRAVGRDKIIEKLPSISTKALAIGMDWWHCFELSWLNTRGISQVAIARMSIPAHSTNIVESKSLKLYLNSFNLTTFTSSDEVKQIIECDLGELLESDVTVEFFSCQPSAPEQSSMHIATVNGTCIDTALDSSLENSSLEDNRVIAITSDVSSEMLALECHHKDNQADDVITQTYHSHLLRSNCPVTNQPDWGSVEITINCPKIDEAMLLEYILTYRQHNGFHEQCVEQIFADLTTSFNPKQLMVRAWYTRRGGIDINPCRVSHRELLPTASRLLRQ